jgi:hypothetical protein
MPPTGEETRADGEGGGRREELKSDMICYRGSGNISKAAKKIAA